MVAAPKQLQQKPAAPPPKPTRLREIKPDKEKSETDKNMQIRMEVCRDVIKEAIRNSGYHPIHYLELVAGMVTVKFQSELPIFKENLMGDRRNSVYA